jgi:uncharacterized protein YjdB
VATVDNGVVTALKAGTATITVRTSNGKTATCVVTVITPTVDVQSVSLDKQTVELTEKETELLKISAEAMKSVISQVNCK